MKIGLSDIHTLYIRTLSEIIDDISYTAGARAAETPTAEVVPGKDEGKLCTQ